ncbi:methylenetetrahydrofolate reductase C-terminal domain-containing protein, partial [Thermovenabulum gondwanense]|uniref:methylenetetrahydrofolate reductase C-terminal domain-containing protein n=1 Tax=Thermovenabulum gondwanense TaxID=520767 RepID=UPI000837E37F
MIITKQKPMEEILNNLQGIQKIYLTGCSLCATSCMTGGEKELIKMKEDLEKEGKKITGYIVLDPSCNKLQVKSTLKKNKEAVEEAEAVLSLACGDGVQTVAGVLQEKPVYPANDTLFIGEVERIGHFTEACRACGECELAWTGGICP